MPRIAADTVAQNREFRVAALMRAGAAILGAGNPLTVESVASAVGISRSSFYEYFSSADALAHAIVAEEVTALATELEPSGDGVADPRTRVRSWTRIRLAQTTSRGQRLLDATGGDPNAADALTAPLRRALEDARVDDAERVADYLVALVDTGMHRIRHGRATSDEETAAMMTILEPLLASERP